MQKARHTEIHPPDEAGTKISYYVLPGLLPPGQKLALNRQTRTLSLLSEGPLLIVEQQFSINELRVIVPILESFPHYCLYEVLLAHVYSKIVTDASIERCRRRLEEAQNQGMRQQELRPIRRVLSSLRSKLHHFGLEISNIRERGCSLTSLTTTSFSWSDD